MRNRRSAFEYDPNTVNPHMTTASTGTETYWDTPKIWNAAPTPANSLTVRPALATINKRSASELFRTENCSRKRPAEPLARVNTQARAHFLDDHERNRYEDHQEQRLVTKLRAGAGVSEDAARVITGVGGYQAWPKNGENSQDAA